MESMGCASRRRRHAPTWRNFDLRARYGSANDGQIPEVDMSFINSSGLDELARRLADSVPESVRTFARDLEGNFKAVLQAQLSKLDLVSREEFDVQAAILERTQAKLTAMEARLKEIEGRLTPQ
jgi:BMFP domain-containing protein YqiC